MARKLATWTVGRTVGYNHGFDWEQTPQSVVAELRHLTSPAVLGREFFSCGVWALPEGVDNPSAVGRDDPARSNYMQVGGSSDRMSLEVRVDDGREYKQYAVARMPVADPRIWVRHSWDLGYGESYSTQLHPEELLTAEQVMPFLRDYILDGRLPAPELLRELDV